MLTICKDKSYNLCIALVLALALIVSYGMHDVDGAPVNPTSGSSSDNLVEKIIQSRLENKCETDQDRKDLCERCIRFLSDTSAGYHGCCTNYDGIYNYCESFLNYSYDRRPATKTTKSDRIVFYHR